MNLLYIHFRKYDKYHKLNEVRQKLSLKKAYYNIKNHNSSYLKQP